MAINAAVAHHVMAVVTVHVTHFRVTHDHYVAVVTVMAPAVVVAHVMAVWVAFMATLITHFMVGVHRLCDDGFGSDCAEGHCCKRSYNKGLDHLIHLHG